MRWKALARKIGKTGVAAKHTWSLFGASSHSLLPFRFPLLSNPHCQIQ